MMMPSMDTLSLNSSSLLDASQLSLQQHQQLNPPYSFSNSTQSAQTSKSQLDIESIGTKSATNFATGLSGAPILNVTPTNFKMPTPPGSNTGINQPSLTSTSTTFASTFAPTQPTLNPNPTLPPPFSEHQHNSSIASNVAIAPASNATTSAQLPTTVNPSQFTLPPLPTLPQTSSYFSNPASIPTGTTTTTSNAAAVNLNLLNQSVLPPTTAPNFLQQFSQYPNSSGNTGIGLQNQNQMIQSLVQQTISNHYQQQQQQQYPSFDHDHGHGHSHDHSGHGHSHDHSGHGHSH
jgi:hypothetical protein